MKLVRAGREVSTRAIKREDDISSRLSSSRGEGDLSSSNTSHWNLLAAVAEEGGGSAADSSQMPSMHESSRFLSLLVTFAIGKLQDNCPSICKESLTSKTSSDYLSFLESDIDASTSLIDSSSANLDQMLVAAAQKLRTGISHISLNEDDHLSSESLLGEDADQSQEW